MTNVVVDIIAALLPSQREGFGEVVYSCPTWNMVTPYRDHKGYTTRCTDYTPYRVIMVVVYYKVYCYLHHKGSDVLHHKGHHNGRTTGYTTGCTGYRGHKGSGVLVIITDIITVYYRVYYL